MSWQSEFGPEYAVPAEITSALEDQSWHNDACPSFGVALDGKAPADGSCADVHELRLWAEHPDLDQRETGGTRYCVNYQPWSNEPIPGVVVTDYGQVYEGDDIAAALAAFAAARTTLEAALGVAS